MPRLTARGTESAAGPAGAGIDRTLLRRGLFRPRDRHGPRFDDSRSAGSEFADGAQALKRPALAPAISIGLRPACRAT